MASIVENVSKPPASGNGQTVETQQVKPARLVQGGTPKPVFRQHFTPRQGNLLYLSCGEFELPPQSESQAFSFPGAETLLFMWQGEAQVSLSESTFELRAYDTLYVPLGSSFRLLNASEAPARIVECSATAQNVHPPVHSKFAEFSRQEERIRHLKGKDVYLMFDVSEPADKL